MQAEYLAKNFGGRIRRPNSENLWLWPKYSAFGRPLVPIMRRKYSIKIKGKIFHLEKLRSGKNYIQIYLQDRGQKWRNCEKIVKLPHRIR